MKLVKNYLIDSYNYVRVIKLKLKEIIDVIEGHVIQGDENTEIENILIDSRKVSREDLFIAIIGTKINSHQFVKNINCKAVIVSDNVKVNKKITVIKVNNTLKSLELLSRYFRKKYNIPLIAITGSVGKTTTKELIGELLETKYNIVKNEQSFNNNIGLPLTMLKVNKDTNLIICELGTNNFGEIKHLSNICKPNVGVITNIGTSHIGNFKTKKNIYLEKISIKENMRKGIIFVNNNDKYLKKTKDKNNLIYKVSYNKKIKFKNINYFYNKTTFDLYLCQNKYEVQFNIPGKKILDNVALAIEVALFFDIEIDSIVKILNNFKNIDNRLDIITINNTTIINDCYNSSYESLINSLEIFKKTKGTKTLILGDILELGSKTNKIYYKIIKQIKKIPNLNIILIGNNLSVIENKLNCPYFKNNNQVINYLKNIKLSSNILIKGSRKLRLEEIVEYLKTKN